MYINVAIKAKNIYIKLTLFSELSISFIFTFLKIIKYIISIKPKNIKKLNIKVFVFLFFTYITRINLIIPFLINLAYIFYFIVRKIFF